MVYHHNNFGISPIDSIPVHEEQNTVAGLLALAALIAITLTVLPKLG